MLGTAVLSIKRRYDQSDNYSLNCITLCGTNPMGFPVHIYRDYDQPLSSMHGIHDMLGILTYLISIRPAWARSNVFTCSPTFGRR